ncbi:esterase/lipase [Cladochytrium replicatum]|nr:esterase/lipase [Cladochytrium replicatum]
MSSSNNPDVHPDLMKSMGAAKRVDFATSNIPLWLMRFLSGFVPAIPLVGVTLSTVHVPGPPGCKPVRTLLIVPKNLPQDRLPPAVLWIHGGGLILGTPEISVPRCCLFALELNAVFALPDYRLAPDHRAPAAVDDCYAVLDWLKNGADGRVDGSVLAVGGESAGGGLAAAVVQMAKDTRVAIRSQILMYPMLDDRSAFNAEEYPEPAGVKIWHRKNNILGWSSYLGEEHVKDPASAPPYAIPGRRVDLSGLAEAWIGVGTEDLFHQEDVEYARRLKDAGVKVELMVVPGAFHAFDAWLDNKSSLRKDWDGGMLGVLKRTLA